MKYMKDMKKAAAHLIDYLEKAMADYVENQDRIRHISIHDWGFGK